MLKATNMDFANDRSLHRDAASKLSKPLEACFQRLFGLLAIYSHDMQAGHVMVSSLPVNTDKEVYREDSTSVVQKLRQELTDTAEQLHAAQRWTAAVEASYKTRLHAALQQAEAAERELRQSAAVAQAASECARETTAARQIAEERAERCEAEMHSLRGMLLEAERQLNTSKDGRLLANHPERRIHSYHAARPAAQSSMAPLRKLLGWR